MSTNIKKIEKLEFNMNKILALFISTTNAILGLYGLWKILFPSRLNFWSKAFYISLIPLILLAPYEYSHILKKINIYKMNEREKRIYFISLILPSMIVLGIFLFSLIYDVISK